MRSYHKKTFKDIVKNINGLGLVLGFYDGVLIGHAQLIQYAKENTKKDRLGGLLTNRYLL